MQPEDRHRRGLPPARDRSRQGRHGRADSRRGWKNREQHGHILHCQLVRHGSIGYWLRRVRWYSLAFTHPFHTARHATWRGLHRHGTCMAVSHEPRQMSRRKCDDDHDSEKAGVHWEGMRKTAGSRPTRQDNCPHAVEHRCRPKPSKNLFIRKQHQNSHTFRKGLNAPGC